MQEVKRPRMSSSSNPTDSDGGKHHEPASGDTESQRNAEIGQTQENPFSSTAASDMRPEVHMIDGTKICETDSQKFMEIQKTILFADKTAFIYDIFNTCARVLHLYAPRRFGKSTFLDTIETFASIKMNEHNEAIPNRKDCEIYKLFMQLELGQKHKQFVEENCGLSPVIRMSFENVEGDDMKGIEEQLKIVVCNIFHDHKYLIKRVNCEWVWESQRLFQNCCNLETFLKFVFKKSELSMSKVQEGLIFLAELLHIHFQQKVVILLDECDTPIMKAVQRGQSDEIVKGIIDLVGDLLGQTLKGEGKEQHIYLGLMTSCTRTIFTWQLNNATHIYFLSDNEFSKLYGFSKEEILKMMSDPKLKSICDKSNVDKLVTIIDIDGINEWYGGYKMLYDKETSIYCGYSLLKYMYYSIRSSMPLFKAYWTGGSYLSSLKKLFRKKEIREPIQQLLDGEPYDIIVFAVTTENILGLRDTMLMKDDLPAEQVDFFLQILSDDGLLNTIGKDAESRTATLMIPNYEIKTMIERHCYTVNLFKDVYQMKPENIATYISTLKFLLTQPGEETCKQFVNAVSNLYSGDAQLPANESEFNAHLYNLAWLYDLNLETRYTRSAEVIGQDEEPGLKCRSKRGSDKEFDILVTSGTAGVIFELKYDCQSAQKALEQIYNKQYYKAFDKKEYAGVEKKIFVGLHMDNKRNVTMSAWLDNVGGKIVDVESDD